ncbi:hypothetical protein L1887_47096 [Cichorium endivia]|nr:hypothetical protein L1887_47096 [Cichorium endivia]
MAVRMRQLRVEAKDKVGERVRVLDGGHVADKRAVVQHRTLLHAPLAKDGRNLQQRLDVVVRVEHGEASDEQRKQDHARRPNVDGHRLVLTLEQHFGRAEAPRTRSIRANGLTCIVEQIAHPLRRRVHGRDARTQRTSDTVCAGGRCKPAVVTARDQAFDGRDTTGKRLARLEIDRVDGTVDLLGSVRMTWCGAGVVTLAAPLGGLEAFGETKVAERAVTGGGIVEKVGGLDVAVHDAGVVYAVQGREEAAKVVLEVAEGHLLVVVAKVAVARVGHDGDDLVLGAEGGDEVGDVLCGAQILHDGELVEDALWTRCDVDLFEGDVADALAEGIERSACDPLVVVEREMLQVDSLVDGREGALAESVDDLVVVAEAVDGGFEVFDFVVELEHFAVARIIAGSGHGCFWNFFFFFFFGKLIHIVRSAVGLGVGGEQGCWLKLRRERRCVLMRVGWQMAGFRGGECCAAAYDRDRGQEYEGLLRARVAGKGEEMNDRMWRARRPTGLGQLGQRRKRWALTEALALAGALVPERLRDLVVSCRPSWKEEQARARSSRRSRGGKVRASRLYAVSRRGVAGQMRSSQTSQTRSAALRHWRCTPTCRRGFWSKGSAGSAGFAGSARVRTPTASFWPLPVRTTLFEVAAQLPGVREKEQHESCVDLPLVFEPTRDSALASTFGSDRRFFRAPPPHLLPLQPQHHGRRNAPPSPWLNGLHHQAMRPRLSFSESLSSQLPSVRWMTFTLHTA